MATNNNVIRVTKAQKFEVIKNFLPESATYTFPGNDEKAPFIFDYTAMVEFLDAELAALAKKNSGDKKQTDAQKNNEKIKEAICDYLIELPADSNGATCAQIAKEVLGVIAPDEATPQKASSMLRQMKDRIGSKEVKGRTFFFAL